MSRQGFLSGSLISRTPLTVLPLCGSCGLYKDCQSPKMPVYGKGGKGILVVGEAPGMDEDFQGRPFVGVSGQLLRTALRRHGIDLTQDCWTTNSVICRPKNNKLPEKSIDYCRPNVISIINQYKPRVILLLGSAAIQSVIGWQWKEDPGGVNRWSGYIIPDRKLNTWIVPTFHPAHILRNQRQDQKDPVEVLWNKHLSRLLGLTERPYDHTPDESNRVRKVVDPDKAIALLDGMVKSKCPLSFDYETDRLKPDDEDSRIVCCAFSDGVSSVAFPWHGTVREKVREILHNPSIRKVGWNIKFEERWTIKEFGKGVAGWFFDGMLATHTLDSRRATKSLKFQAYARLGFESYDDAIEEYLKANNGNLANRLVDISIEGVLGYCALDALLEYYLAQLLAKELGIPF